jgi:predicted component of viral defense system (DUF524 family)
VAGGQALVLFENLSYQWMLVGAGAEHLSQADIASTLKGGAAGRKAVWNGRTLKGKPPEGSFRVSNYLGTAEIRVAGLEAVRFEIQTRKLDFHGEYRAMVDDIAEHCQQLLLEWDSPTSFQIGADPEQRRRTLLEQFLFLRHVLGEQRLGVYLEEMGQRPHVALRTEREWRPSAFANSPRFASDPLRHARGWVRGAPAEFFQANGLSPEELRHERRFETFDTAPNRFVKFALEAFAGVCDEVLAEFDGARGTAWMEAREMRETLDVFLARPFFADVSPLRRLPLENQTLQKRGGYREILGAWLMLEAAAKLDWPGRDDAYDGTNRDAATLYEFWLYFVLRRLLAERLGMREIPHAASGGPGALPFVTTSERGGLQVNLAQSKASLSRYLWTAPDGGELCVHLYYNRTFSPARDPLASGSYSRHFRPDYSLAFFPASYAESSGDGAAAEKAAERDGRIGYLHFDAKFRIESVEEALGVEKETAEALDEERALTKSTDTYKRGDLYKMHTYNDAIRRTAGSYVLYPGRDAETLRKDFPRYEEVIPGVGAFRMRPGDTAARGECEKVLSAFIADVLAHHENKFSRDYRIRHWTHATLQETPPAYGAKPRRQPAVPVPMADAPCVLGYVRPGQAGFVRRKGRFYFYAVDKNSGATRNYDRPVFHAKYFIGHNRSKTLPWLAEVKTLKLADAGEIARLTKRNPAKVGAAYYYLLELGDALECQQVSVAGLVKRRGGEPVLLTLQEIFGSSVSMPTPAPAPTATPIPDPTGKE